MLKKEPTTNDETAIPPQLHNIVTKHKHGLQMSDLDTYRYHQSLHEAISERE